jgi:K+-sensing histidine kinase KdpD
MSEWGAAWRTGAKEFQRIHSPTLRYGFAVVSVTIALGVALALQHYQFRDVELPVLTVAIALTTWYAGGGPSVLAVLLSSASFDYFFTEPLHSFEISRRDLPYFFNVHGDWQLYRFPLPP